MKFLELAKERYSVRKFDSREIEKEKMDVILEAARVAPTATNAQPQKIYIVESEEGMEKLSECTPCCFNAKTAIIVCYDDEESWKRSKFDGEDSGVIDSAIIGTHIMLQAAELGLGTTWVGFFNPEKVSENFNLPDNIIPKAIFPIGYPAEDCEPSEKHFKRKELSETVKYI